MFKIEGLEELQQELEEASNAMKGLDGTLGTVSFNPSDPASIEAAIAEFNRLIDERLGMYARNTLVAPLVDQMKEQYRAAILEQAAGARLKGDNG
ncbi:hypothetical protein GJ689_21535 [Rhodoplanes serenus]|uniref:Uncharacterized protein n=1 Tax=Rhodoplanes serenus TaxID=200615 RepID=A0A9X4XQ94_9BRAD|nr:hypothetical protein [Rhodoplanes serenus]MTW18787.1 hypothetical protein [Rhodoplanes serenus]